MKAERTKAVAHALETGAEVSRGLQTHRGVKAAPKVLARLAQRFTSAARGKLADQDTDQVRETAVGKLDGLEFRRDVVDLGRTPSSRSAPAAETLERNDEKSRFRQPIQTATRDVSVDAERRGGIVRRTCLAPAPRVKKNPAKLRITGRCEAVERHKTER